MSTRLLVNTVHVKLSSMWCGAVAGVTVNLNNARHCVSIVWFFFFVKRPKNANKVQQLTTEISLNYKLTWKVESAAVRVAACGNGSEKLLKRNIYSQQTLCRANMTVIIAAKQKYKIFQFFCCCFFQRSTRVCRPYALWRAPCVGEILLWSLTLCG